MATSNPAFSRSPVFAGEGRQPISLEQLNELYGRPAATPVETGRMSYNDTIMKTLITFGVLVIGALVGWVVPILALPGVIVGLVLGLVNVFKKKPSKALVLSYAGFQGLFVGGISAIFNSMWDGIVTQAVFGTLGVVGVTLVLFLNGTLRSSPRLTRIFIVAMFGYLAFSLVNFGLMAFGATDSMFGLRDTEFLGIPLGLILGVFIVLLAAYSLVLDFEAVKNGVNNGAPEVFGWQAAFGIVATVIWLYVEILRILAILRQD
jgi:uncharacterized YccA/Bax inhibitor family protein